jgi:hypothetical protein
VHEQPSEVAMLDWLGSKGCGQPTYVLQSGATHEDEEESGESSQSSQSSQSSNDAGAVPTASPPAAGQIGL